jgi:hypothetical protein
MTQPAAAPAVRHVSLDETLDLFRRELKLAFPGVKFRIRRSRGTGYGYVSVSYTDGPVARDVDAIASAYEGAGFDGSTDSQFSIEHVAADGEGNPVVLRYGTKGIHVTREISPARLANAMRIVLHFYGDWQNGALALRLETASDAELLDSGYRVESQNGRQSLYERTRAVLELRDGVPASLLAMAL